MSASKVVLVTDSKSSRVKASSIQTVIEVAGVEPSEAVRFLSANDWNASEAIAECVNLREFRERLRQQAELYDESHRLCVLSVHLIKLANLKHTGMHAVRLELDGEIQQTGWISGEHSKLVGVSFEFRRFRPESKLGIEVWHKRVFRENKRVGFQQWRLSTLAEDPIMRFRNWIPLSYKHTTGGSVQAEIWLRFFDIPSPSTMSIRRDHSSSIAEKDTVSASSDKKHNNGNQQKRPVSDVNTPSSNTQGRGAGQAVKTEEKKGKEDICFDRQIAPEVRSSFPSVSTASRSLSLLDSFFSTPSEAQVRLTSALSSSCAVPVEGVPCYPLYDLASLDSTLFTMSHHQEDTSEGRQPELQKVQETQRRTQSNEVLEQENLKVESEATDEYRSPEEGPTEDRTEEQRVDRKRKRHQRKKIRTAAVKSCRPSQRNAGPSNVPFSSKLYPDLNDESSSSTSSYSDAAEEGSGENPLEEAFLSASSLSESHARRIPPDPLYRIPPDPWKRVPATERGTTPVDGGDEKEGPDRKVRVARRHSRTAHSHIFRRDGSALLSTSDCQRVYSTEERGVKEPSPAEQLIASPSPAERHGRNRR